MKATSRHAHGNFVMVDPFTVTKPWESGIQMVKRPGKLDRLRDRWGRPPFDANGSAYIAVFASGPDRG